MADDETRLELREQTNPLYSLGFEPTAIKSLPRNMRLPFIRKVAKLMAEFHHPDKFANAHPSERDKHSRYLARINQAVEALKDPFLLEKALDDFNSEQNPAVALELRLQGSQRKIRALELQLEAASQKIETIVDPRTVEQRVLETCAEMKQEEYMGIAYRTPLTVSLKGRIQFSPILQYDPKVVGDLLAQRIGLEKKLANYFDASKSPEQISGKLSRREIKTTSGDSHEIIGTILYANMVHLPTDPWEFFTLQMNSFDSSTLKSYLKRITPYLTQTLESQEYGLTVIKSNRRDFNERGQSHMHYSLVPITKINVSDVIKKFVYPK